jgi:hypothetical protein
MAFQFDETHVYDGQSLVCKENKIPIALGVGPTKIKCSSYHQGPLLVGSENKFPFVYATVMIGPSAHGAPTPIVPGALCSGISNPYSLAVSGPSAFLGNVDTNSNVAVGLNLLAQGEVISNCGGHLLSAKKNFDIPHPTKGGYRLRHTCPEGPSNDVYFRGKLRNKKEILLPGYWEKLVDPTTITVNLTPIGAHQNIIVKRISDNKIYLQANGGMPINCYYHVFGTRADGERLIAEYEGESPTDYPGNNNEYSISGYHYDIKEN